MTTNTTPELPTVWLDRIRPGDTLTYAGRTLHVTDVTRGRIHLDDGTTITRPTR